MTKVLGSRTKNAAFSTARSTEIAGQLFAANRQHALFSEGKTLLPGSMNDAQVVRHSLIESIRKSGKSREAIADEMSVLTGTQVTVRRLNAFTAESREDYRWPAELDRAFCEATGCYDLIRTRVELAGFSLITEAEAELLELGREYLRQKRANERVQMLEKRLVGVEL